MDEITTLDADAAPAVTPVATALDTPERAGADEVVDDELLIEEVSIDGMCGVY